MMKKYVCDKEFLHDIKNDDRNVIDLDNINPETGPEDSDKSQPSSGHDDCCASNPQTPIKRKNLAEV